ncbi:DUF1014-domain-containing protein [Atractiella rhizophila]|nr:DUF1014-domain-containing protein [Atractiella rhizophila]
MAPKGKPGENAKKETGRAKKAANEAQKAVQKAADAEAKEAEKWSQGAKGKSAKEDKVDKAAAAAARKAENARLLAEEEASAPKTVKSGPTAKGKSAPKPATAASASAPKKDDIPDFDQPESFSASGIDDALDMLTLVTEKKDKAAEGARAAQSIDSHPERRFKAAFEAYKDRELEQLKKERPGMRLNQYHDILYKQFQKSPDNPFNQVTVSYDATKEEKVGALRKQREEVERRLKGTNFYLDCRWLKSCVDLQTTRYCGVVPLWKNLA